MTLSDALDEVAFQNQDADCPHVLVQVVSWNGAIEYYASKLSNARKSNYIPEGYGGRFQIIS